MTLTPILFNCLPSVDFGERMITMVKYMEINFLGG